MSRKRPKRFITDNSSHSRLRKRWRALLPAMSAELSDLLGKREIFWELQEVAKDNQTILKNGTFFDWMCRNYVVAAAIHIRRFVDHSHDAHSLWRMLYELLEHPGIINRRSNRVLYRGVPKDKHFDIADMSFDSVVGERSNTLSQNAIRKDLRELEDISERVRKFVNKRIAHRTPAGSLRKLPIFIQLDRSMDVIDRLFCKYNLLLTASGMTTTHATRQHDWMEVLYEAWIPIGSKFRPDT